MHPLPYNVYADVVRKTLARPHLMPIPLSGAKERPVEAPAATAAPAASAKSGDECTKKAGGGKAQLEDPEDVVLARDRNPIDPDDTATRVGDAMDGARRRRRTLPILDLSDGGKSDFELSCRWDIGSD